MRAPLGLLLLGALAAPVRAQQPAPIQDNSFLIEEAYNQESRVVQHISAFFRSSAGDWLYTFTQEWPLFGQRSQLSYTLPLMSGGFGDLALNYRLQLVGTGPLAFSPRLSLVLPTGTWEQGRGSGAIGLQANLPVSAHLGKRLVTHWNAGASVTPSARTVGGSPATVWTYGLGGSAVVVLRHDVNVLVEMVWTRADGDEELLLNPGIRWAHTLANGLQIVPGIGVPLGLGPSREPAGLFLYLSLEHAF